MLLRIAIVDDLPQDAERLQQALTAEGQTNIIRYESGDALLSAISPEQLDALFLDICMEGTNGIDTARKLREQAPTLPIVFVTSSKEYVWQSFRSIICSNRSSKRAFVSCWMTCCASCSTPNRK